MRVTWVAKDGLTRHLSPPLGIGSMASEATASNAECHGTLCTSLESCINNYQPIRDLEKDGSTKLCWLGIAQATVHH